MSDRLTRATFEPYLGTQFVIEMEPGVEFALTLVEVSALPPTIASPHLNLQLRGDPFSLLFEGEKEPMLRPRIYEFRHAHAGVLKIFITPVGWGRYEAVFN